MARVPAGPILGAVDRRITVLPRVVDETDGKPVRPEAPDNQRLMAEILREPSIWTPELAGFTTEVFDALSTNWVDEHGVDARRAAHPVSRVRKDDGHRAVGTSTRHALLPSPDVQSPAQVRDAGRITAQWEAPP